MFYPLLKGTLKNIRDRELFIERLEFVVNTIKTLEDFFKKISKGGIKSKLTNGKSDRVDFTDGTTITYRVITSIKGSKSVDIKVVSKSEGGISTQKIHFVKED